MVYIPPINNKLGPTEAPMASKNLGSKTIGSSIQSFFFRSMPRPVTRIKCGGVLTRPKWTKLLKCFFLFNFLMETSEFCNFFFEVFKFF